MITTIITTYRRPELLKRAVNSVLNQTHSQFQLHVYDNASDDETPLIMQKIVKKDSRVIYHRHAKNIGMMENYQFAFERIDSPFFNFLSDDDYLLPCFFETALKGFEDYPDAAFSACGIAQLNEHGSFISDPLSFWDKEGYFAAQEGMLHMIKKHKFPVPTGVLFQNKFVKNVKPDFSKEIQIYWDPDYLVQIAARYPIVVNKKHCGIYLVHSNSFAYSVYSSLLQNLSNVEIYLVATNKLMERIKKNEKIKTFYRLMSAFYFKRNVREDTITFIKTFIQVGKYGGAHYASKKFYTYFGFSLKIFWYHGIATLLKVFSLMHSFIERVFKLLVKHKKTIGQNFNAEEMESYHNYGKKLSSNIKS